MRWTVVALLAAFTTPVQAQYGQDTILKVLRHTPDVRATSGAVVTVTFDRPVAGALDRAVDASQVIHIVPAIRGRLGWRDPVTIWFVPDEPLVPGSRYTVTVGNSFRALDGSALAAPFRFTFTVTGPAFLTYAPRADNGETLGPNDKLFLLYSAPVDLAALQRVRLELTCEGSPRIALAPISQRSVRVSDGYPFLHAGGYDRDTIADRFRRVVELRPLAPIPGDCTGWLAVPRSVAAGAGPEVDRYPVRTRPAFRVDAFACNDGPACLNQSAYLYFSAPVEYEQVRRYVRLEPRTPVTVDPNYLGRRRDWYVRAALKARTKYSLVIDTAMRDVYGRRLLRTALPTIEPADREPSVTLGAGLLTLPRAGPRVVSLRHVNVDSALITLIRVPDTQRSAALATSNWWGGSDPWQPTGGVVQVAWPLGGPFNEERTTRIRVDELAKRVGGAGLLAMQVDVAVPSAPPESLGVARGRERPDPSVRMPFALLQLTDLVAHTKLSGNEGSVFVTGISDGLPRIGAQVTLYDEHNTAIARGTTDSSGVASLETIRRTQTLQHANRARIVSRGLPAAAATRFVEVTHGADRSVVPVSGAHLLGHYYSWPPNPLDPARLGARSLDESPIAGLVFTERGIYRPGEVVFAKGIIRTGSLDALRRPQRSDSVRWLIQHRKNPWDDDDEAETIRDTVVALSSFGTAVDSLRLRPTTSLGRYTIELQLRSGADTVRAAYGEFRVAEYRAPEFLVDATAVDTMPRFPGDTVSATVTARYLFGAPMGSARVDWSTTAEQLSPGQFTIPRTAGWIVGEYGDRWDHHRPSGVGAGSPAQSTLDSGGRTTLRIAVPNGASTRPSQLILHAAVTDVNRQVVTASARFLIHPAAVYIAARQSNASWLWHAGTPQSIELRTVSTDGGDVTGVPMLITVVRRHWVQDTRGGGPYYGWRSVVDTVKRDSLVTGERPVVYSFTPREGGEYRVRVTARDERRREAATSLSAYVVGGRSWWMGDSPYRLPLLATKDSLAVGDTAVVVFDSPFDRAEAWMTVEREGLLEQRRLRVRRGPTTLRIPLREGHVPNVFVSVVLVKTSNRTASVPDSAQQVLRAGYTELHVDPDVKRLRVSVMVLPPERGPGDTATVRLDVRDRGTQGVKSEVAVWAVDEGVLALTNYASVEPVGALYKARGVGSRLQTALTTLLVDPMLRAEAQRRAAARRAAARRAAAGRGAAARMRGGTALESVVVSRADTVRQQLAAVYTTGMEVPPPPEIPAELLRHDFRTTAFFIGNLVTDHTGSAVVRAKLPDNLTSYVVFAVAVTDGDRYGAGRSSFVVTRPLVARPALPRFVRPSDTLVAGPVVNARDGAERAVRVDAAVQNAQLVGSPWQSVTLGRGRGAEVRFMFVVPSRDSARDAALFRFGIAADVGRDAVETRLDVRPDFHRRAHTVIGVVRDSTNVEVGLPGDIDPARSRLSLRVGTSPLIPMLAAYERLRVYPYYCTEQLSSGARALVAIYQATRGQPRSVAALGADPVATLQRLADELALRQREDGAIGFWRATDWSSAWLSAYAGLFLLDARAAGVVVDRRVIDNLASYLTAAASDTLPHGGENPAERTDRRRQLGERVAAIDFLRRAARADRSAENRLLARATHMTWEDRLRLAEALASRPDVASRLQALLDDAWRGVRVAGARVDLPDSTLTGWSFPSRIRPAARLLTATLALRPDHPLLGALVETVLQHGRAERYWAWNTQDYASVVTALAQLGGESAAEDRRIAIVVGERTLLDRSADDRSERDSTVALTGWIQHRAGRATLPVRLVASGKGEPVFFALRIDEVPSRVPVTPDADGIAVERWYERFDDGTPVTSVAEGDLVRVRLRVTVPADRQFVVVDDALPAGLEPVDLSLRTSAPLGPFATPESESARERGDRNRDGPRAQAWYYGGWDNGWWSPWEHKEIRDDRVVYFARMLWRGTYTATYVARATTRGSFVRPPAHAEEMYNPGVHGRSDGGRFVVSAPPR